MDVGTVYTDAVTVPQGRRPVKAETVGRLAESIKAIGLQQPISVWSPDAETVVLVAGAHRLEACRRLDIDEIPAVFVEMDELEREMWEISENLHRLDLTKNQRDEQIRRYAELVQARDDDAETARTECPTSLSDGRVAGPQHQKGVATKVAEETGLSSRTVRRVLNPKPAATPPDEKNPVEVSNTYRTALMNAWNRAPREDREWFLAEVDKPVMDGRYGA